MVMRNVPQAQDQMRRRQAVVRLLPPQELAPVRVPRLQEPRRHRPRAPVRGRAASQDGREPVGERRGGGTRRAVGEEGRWREDGPNVGGTWRQGGGCGPAAGSGSAHDASARPGREGKAVNAQKENRPSTDSSRSAATKRSTDGDRTAPFDALPISTLAAPKGSARERILPASFSSPTDVSPVTLKSPPSFSSSSTKAPPETPVDWDDPAFVRPGACPGEQYALAVMFFQVFDLCRDVCASTVRTERIRLDQPSA
ncbi:hypothetical protein DFJ73DRAFT_241810 [Zopfochytrium polystomum]|nr:hypothetical protein DFJ73DRAFT_241810 [Zopfochytrium polystomum]